MEINWLRLLLLLSPILLVQIGLCTYALIDLARRRRVRGSRGLWAGLLIVTALGLPSGIIVSGLYLAWGRHVEAFDDSD